MLKELLEKIKVKLKEWFKKYFDCDCGEDIKEKDSKEEGVNDYTRSITFNVSYSPKLLNEYMNSSDGRKVILNLISNNKNSFRNALGVK